MPRFIMQEHHTGFIWGDTADMDNVEQHVGLTPIEAVQAMLQNIDPSAAATTQYEEHNRAPDGVSGFHIYRADINGSDAVTVVQDGQDKDTIAAVVRDCEYVCFVETRTVDPDEEKRKASPLTRPEGGLDPMSTEPEPPADIVISDEELRKYWEIRDAEPNRNAARREGTYRFVDAEGNATGLFRVFWAGAGDLWDDRDGGVASPENPAGWYWRADSGKAADRHFLTSDEAYANAMRVGG